MEEATKVSSEVNAAKGASEDLCTVDVSVKDVNGEMTKEDKVMVKEEEDTTFDGGFVKVEKEGIDAKDDEKAENSKSRLLETEQRILIRELSQELDKKKASESRFQEELLALKDLKGKVSEQESINLKLREDQEGIIRTANEKLAKALEEKQVLETSLAEITSNAAKTKEICDELEEKLKISDEKLCKTDALLHQALSNNSDLEQRLEYLEEVFEEVSQLKSALIVAEEEGKESARQMQEYQDKATKLESSLNQSSARISELEEDLITSLQKGAEHEDLGNLSTQRIVELEGLFQTSQSKLEKAEEKLKDLEAIQVKNSSLEAALSVAMGKEKELSENLNAVICEKKALEDTVDGYSVKVTESENMLRVLSSELDLARGKLESSGNDMEAAGFRESKAMEKLKSAEERLEKQAREIDEVTTRSIELEALHKHSELRVEKAMEEFSIRDTEAKSLTEKSKDLDERIRLYEEKLAEASAHSFSLKEDLDQLSFQNELLADTNNHLKIKIQELEGYLEFEKENTTRQTEEATKRFNQRDIEAKDLIAKLKSHENLIEEHKRQVLEASGVADTSKKELEDALSKLKAFEATIKELEKENGSLAEVNLKLNQELANHGSETSDFHVIFSALEAEKDQTAKELEASKTAVEELTNQLTSEGERLRSKMSSLAEENNQVNEIYQSTKSELVKLEEQLQVEKSKSDAMVSEIKKLSAVAAEKAVWESNFEEVGKQLKKAEAKLREEKEAVTEKHSELEATLKKSQEELEAKKSMIVHLESLLKDLEQKVQLADASSKKQNLQETDSTGKGEVEVKSRDIELSFSNPKQGKSKKEPDASPSHSSSSSGNVTTQKAETSHLMTLKIVLGVALVSVIIGIILGKKY